MLTQGTRVAILRQSRIANPRVFQEGVLRLETRALTSRSGVQVTTSRPKKPAEPPHATAKEPASDGLLDSEELFGDILGDLGGEAVDLRPEAAPPTRKGPIKVQVTEPGSGIVGPAKTGAAKGPVTLPPEVEALLDAFSGPAEEASRKEPPAAPPPVPPPPPQTAGPVRTEPLRLAPEDVDESFAPVDDDEVFSSLGTGEGLGEEDLEFEDIPVIASRTATKFQIAPPKKEAESSDLDLAAVAEEALGPGAAAPTRPGREGSWRDDVFGPYRLIDRIAVGGMAEVFKARRSGLEGFEKTVALKKILPHLSDNKEFVDMFKGEAEMVAGLAHPNIVQIFDLGKIDKTYYIEMEYVHGRDLRTILKQAKEKGLRLPLDLSLRIVGQVCSALEYAHRKKDNQGRPMEIVHRDVSPQNILISFEGDVKLTDFGIAKAATKASTTDRGALRGKLLYMSPEQAWGKPIDRRSDLFSLGIVLYEMVTDQRPFLGGSEMSILEMVRQCRIAAPATLNPRIPESLERVMMKALAKDADERFQDAGEMGRSLDRVARERQPPSATELARFMELLFEPEEREEADGRAASSAPSPRREAPAPPAAAPLPDVGGDAESGPEMSVDALLKRFGIK
jgi:serine/threonine protein kinase